MKEHLKIAQEEIASGGAILLDVREEDEWKQGHLRLATLCPLSALQLRIKPSIDFSKKLYLHCRSGKRVFTAEPILRELGAKDVVPLSEGYAELAENFFESVS